ncbi:SAM-dependent chlorinase/fluorinase [candidate division KSB1 bacterium]|nr:SAM-dependent chlorinase/fluorinase [candidate division KSB1 bacterium]
MPISLTTDFGLDDVYAGVMKGVILSINPEAQIIDLTHGIQPQHIEQAAFILHANYQFFPEGTIHVVVVDPGVGSERAVLGVKTSDYLFVAPDNGVLKYIFEAHPQAEIYKLNNSRYWLQPTSQTFHGRDIFAPVAAHLSRGVELSHVGKVFPGFERGQIDHPEKESRQITGRILFFDRFGNGITNIQRSQILGSKVQIHVKELTVTGIQNIYADVKPGAGLAYIGSSQTLEIAVGHGNARDTFNLKAGDPVVVLLDS